MFVMSTELGYEVHVVVDGVSSSRWLDRAVGLQVTSHLTHLHESYGSLRSNVMWLNKFL